MPALAEPLTAKYIGNLPVKDITYTAADGGGLFIEVRPSGAKVWRFRWRLHKKPGLITIGNFPAVSLVQARKIRADYLALLAQGITPKAAKDTAEENTVSAVVGRWLAVRGGSKRKPWRDTTLNNYRCIVDRYWLPALGDRLLSTLTKDDIRAMAAPMASRPRVAAHAVRLFAQMVSWYNRRADQSTLVRNYASDVWAGMTVPETKHQSAILDLPTLGQFLRAIAAYRGNLIVRYALELAILIPVRASELTSMRWEDIDAQAMVWNCPTSKTGQPLCLPLSTQAYRLIERLREIRSSDTWVFCSPRRTDKPLSRNTLYVAVQSTGFLDRTCVHGFRSTFSSLAVGYCKVNPLIAELCIGHKIKLSMEDTYQRWHFLEEKRQALQSWADFIDRVREGRS